MIKENKEPEDITLMWIKRGIAGFILIILLFNAVVSVPAGHRKVVFNRFTGVDMQPMEEGWHFKIPFVESTYKFEVREQKEQIDSPGASKDLQEVLITIALNFHVLPENTPKLYRDVGLDYKNRIILPATHEAVKSVIARYNAEELIQKRPDVSNGIKNELQLRLQRNGILIDDFSIVNFDFSEAFNLAIEEKQVAEQKALTAQRDLERVKFEADQIREVAMAEADEIRIKSEALQGGSQVIELRKIEAQIKALDTWDGKLPTFMGGGAIPFINIDSGINLNE